MGNKCCSKGQDQDSAFTYPSGYNNKKHDYNFGQNNLVMGQKHSNGGSLDSRYTPDPNRGPIKQSSKGGVDIIRPRNTPSEYFLIFVYKGKSICVESNEFFGLEI